MVPASPLRLLFLGTPEFAVPSLVALAESAHSVVGVISQPDRPRGRGRKLAPTPVRAAAEERSLPVLQPEKVGAPEALAWMRERRPDLGVVVAFGQFVPRAVRELPRLEMINAHGSLLPRHRGAAPIQHALLAGDAVTGISVIRLVREMDAGPECLRLETQIGPEETAGELAQRLAELAADALVEATDRLAAGTAEFVEQDSTRATLAPKVDRSFGELDFGRPRGEILRRLRAATPWPGSTLELRSGPRLKLLRARDAGPFEAGPASPGRVESRDGRLRIAALDGWIEVLRLQVPGRRPAEARDYLRGASLSEEEEVSTP